MDTNFNKKRTYKLVLGSIFLVLLISLCLSCPELFLGAKPSARQGISDAQKLLATKDILSPQISNAQPKDSKNTYKGSSKKSIADSTKEEESYIEAAVDTDSMSEAKKIHNVLVIGSDVYDNDREIGRTDVMMLLSYNPNESKAYLTSFMRDIWIDIPNHGLNRLNAAHAFGGPDMLIDTINENFSIDIKSYVLIDFNGLISIVDSIGGIETTLTKEEVRYINRYDWDEKSKLPEKDGVYLLNGSQALTHCRNRTVGNADFERTRRQRDVMVGLYSSVKDNSSPKVLWKLLLSSLKYVGTNMNLKELIDLGMTVMSDDKLEIEQMQIPLDDTWSYASKSGRSVLEIDLNINREELSKIFS